MRRIKAALVADQAGGEGQSHGADSRHSHAGRQATTRDGTGDASEIEQKNNDGTRHGGDGSLGRPEPNLRPSTHHESTSNLLN